MSGTEDSAGTGYFENEVAHYFILGCALFSIFWGVVNAILVSYFYFPNLIFLGTIG